jgi:hypothetical protein
MLGHAPDAVIDRYAVKTDFGRFSHMTLGPLEYLVIGFEGNKNFDGSIAKEIENVVNKGIISLVDVVFIGRADNGDAVVLELDNRTTRATRLSLHC